MYRTASLVGVAITLLLAAPATPAVDTTARIPALYRNCTNLNKRYPHGVGRLRARDKTSGQPVTTFKRSTTLYNRAMSYNKGLDRDKDGIACEKK
jgi:excalibur calcium-binding domain-containing protein